MSSGRGQPGDIGDDELLEQLRHIAAEADPVPERLLEAARSAFGLRELDALLAELVHDSAVDAPAMALRGVDAERLLSFKADAAGIECQVSMRGPRRDIIGQLVGGGTERMEVQVADTVTSVPVNDHGRFSARDLPPGLVRMRCRLADGTDLVTSWAVI